MKARALGVRVANLRIGLVLGTDGGMLAQMLPAFEYGCGARFGKGRHWMPWIDRDDLVRLIAHTISASALSGPVNAVAPAPVQNRDFVAILGRALHRPVPFAIPTPLLCLAAGDLARELFLAGQRVVPEKALASGFVFNWPTLDAALATMLGARAPQRPQITVATTRLSHS